MIEQEDYELGEEPSQTWRLDLENKRIGGTADGLDAVAQAAFMALQTPRYQHLIYSWQYGSELDTLTGLPHDYAMSEAKRMVRDALSADSRITGVRDFIVQNSTLLFTIDTIYGSWQIGTEVLPS